MSNLAAAYQVAGRVSQAIPLFEEVLAARRSKLTTNHPDTLKSVFSLAQAYRDAGRTGEAIPLLEQAVALRKTTLSPDHPDTMASIGNLGAAYLEMNRFADAEAPLRESLRFREQQEPDTWRRFLAMCQLGASLAGQAKYADAEPMLIGGFEGLLARERQVPPRVKKEVASAAARIVPFYKAWGRPAQAARWWDRLSLDVAPKS
jgi:tetratricopeptide (TPR) repeat protein